MIGDCVAVVFDGVWWQCFGGVLVAVFGGVLVALVVVVVGMGILCCGWQLLVVVGVIGCLGC